MKKGFIVVGGILAALCAAGGSVWYINEKKTAEVSDADAVYVESVSTIVGTVSGITNRYAGVVEPQNTVKVSIESGRTVKNVNVKTGQEVKTGQLLFEYDLSSIQEDLQQAKLDLDRLKNEALGLTDQIATLEKEKKQASKDNQLSYTIQIETNKMNLKKNEYDQISKEAEIAKLENATVNTEVRSEIDGVIQKIDTSKMTTEDGDVLSDSYSDGMMSDSGEDNDAFITILSTGAYRVKGQINELEAQSLLEGEPMIIRSRVDNDQTWSGILTEIDRENAVSDNSSMYYYGMMSGNSQTSSSSYPFYVDLASSEGLMLGQHVYIERDNGQNEQKTGLWLSEFYIVDADTDAPYIWAADENNRLEKRSVTLGSYDPEMCEYEIAEGLDRSDYIAFPDDEYKEGVPVTTNIEALSMNSSEDSYTEEDWTGEDFMDEDGSYVVPDEYEYDDMMDDADMDMSDIIIEDDFDMDMDMDDELIPMDEFDDMEGME